MPINFPSGPSTNDLYFYNGRTWKYSGEGWKVNTANAIPVAVVDGGTGAITAANAITNLGAASNTYVQATFAGNTYVQSNFASNSYVLSTFAANTYVNAQLTTKASTGKAIAMAIVFGG